MRTTARQGWKLILCGLLFVAPLVGHAPRANAQAGPPLLTDDPGTPGSGRWEINVAVALEWQQSERGYEAPRLDINYGLGDRTQPKFEIPWVILDANGEATKSGLGNSRVGFTYCFLGENGRLPAVSVQPQVECNNSTSSDERGLVDRGTQVLRPVELAKTFGPLVSVLELGYNIVEKGSDEWLYGLAFSYSASKRLELLGEIHGIDDQPVFNFGTRNMLGKHFTLLASAGRGFRGEPKLLGYLGLRMNF